MPVGFPLTNGTFVQQNADWNAVSGVSQILNKPTIPTVPTNVSAFTNDAGYITNTALSPYLTSGSAAATYLTISSAGTTYLSIANAVSTYATQTSLTSGLATKQNTITLGTTSQYFRGDLSLATFPAIPSVLRTTSAFTPALVGTGATGTQASATKDATIRGTFSTSVTITLGGAPVSRVVMKIAPTNDSNEANWVEVGRTGTSQPTTLSVTVGGVYLQEGQIIGDVPAGYYYKFENSGTGTHAEAVITGQQTVYG